MVSKWLMTVAAISGTLSSAADAQATAAAAEPISWNLNWSPPYCQISSGDPKQLAISIWTAPGSGIVSLYFVGAGSRVPQIGQGVKVGIRLSPSGSVTEAVASWLAPVWTGVLRVTAKDGKFLDELSKANELNVEGGGKSVRFPVPGADQVVQAIKQCTSLRAKEWGVDEAALSTLKVLPQLQPNTWITYSDFPQDALDSSTSGTVAARVTIDPQGKVQKCDVMLNTGPASMGLVTCRVALKRARFSPAIGSDGQPTTATVVEAVEFKVFG